MNNKVIASLQIKKGIGTVVLIEFRVFLKGIRKFEGRHGMFGFKIH